MVVILMVLFIDVFFVKVFSLIVLVILLLEFVKLLLGVVIRLMMLDGVNSIFCFVIGLLVVLCNVVVIVCGFCERCSVMDVLFMDKVGSVFVMVKVCWVLIVIELRVVNVVI